MPLSDAELALRWEDEAQLLPFSSAERVRSAAQSWNGYISALLGVIGLAGVAFVPGKVGEVAQAVQAPVLGLGILVVLLGLAALVLSALAAGVVPQFIWSDGQQYRQAALHAARTGAAQLAWSRWLTFAAVACLLLAAGLATFWHDRPASYAVVFQAGGPALCGTPVLQPGGVLALRVGGTVEPLRSPTGLSPVPACPAPAP